VTLLSSASSSSFPSSVTPLPCSTLSSLISTILPLLVLTPRPAPLTSLPWLPTSTPTAFTTTMALLPLLPAPRVLPGIWAPSPFLWTCKATTLSSTSWSSTRVTPRTRLDRTTSLRLPPKCWTNLLLETWALSSNRSSDYVFTLKLSCPIQGGGI